VGKYFHRPHLKNTKYQRRAGRVEQVIECLLSKYETLSSNPSTENKKKEKEGSSPSSVEADLKPMNPMDLFTPPGVNLGNLLA
jgi:hypothetical protein